MNWFYSENGQQRGPVDDAQLDQLVAAGTVTPETLVWSEGMANWLPHGQARPAPGAAPASVGGGVLCASCGRTFSPDDVVRMENRFVCQSCKPIVLQQLREGVALPVGGEAGQVSEADLLARDYTVEIGADLRRGWEIFKADAGIIIGASVLVYLALIACSVVPFLGVIAQLVLQGPLLGGLWLFYILKVRGRQAGINDAFSGFGPRFVPLFLAMLIPSLIIFAVVFVVAAVFAVSFVGVSQAARAGGGGGEMPTALMIGFGLVGFVFFCAMVFIQTCWMFALPLVADKGLGFWRALELSRKVVMKHFWRTLLLMIVIGLLAGVGLLACVVGMLVTAPVAFLALASHYERVFGDLSPEP